MEYCFTRGAAGKMAAHAWVWGVVIIMLSCNIMAQSSSSSSSTGGSGASGVVTVASRFPDMVYDTTGWITVSINTLPTSNLSLELIATTEFIIFQPSVIWWWSSSSSGGSSELTQQIKVTTTNDAGIGDFSVNYQLAGANVIDFQLSSPTTHLTITGFLSHAFLPSF